MGSNVANPDPEPRETKHGYEVAQDHDDHEDAGVDLQSRVKPIDRDAVSDDVSILMADGPLPRALVEVAGGWWTCGGDVSASSSLSGALGAYK